MPAREAGVPAAIAEALERRDAQDRANGYLQLGPLLRITLRTADVPRAVAHGIDGAVPDGFLAARATGAVECIDWDEWTATVAYLRARAAGTVVEGRFFTWSAPEAATDA